MQQGLELPGLVDFIYWTHAPENGNTIFFQLQL